jgi:arylsulfatase A
MFYSFSKKHLSIILLSGLVFCSCTKPSSLQPENKIEASNAINLSSQPNIILILADDIGYEIPTCNGGRSYQTPTIDKMASEGMRFTQCYSAPLCSASRFELLTGKYNFRNYVNPAIMDPNEKTFATLLRDAGYKTYVAGKWQFDGGDTSIHSLGFDDYMVWDPFASATGSGSRYKNPVLYQDSDYIPRELTDGKYGEDLLTADVLDFIKSSSKDKFFVYYPVCIAHPPFCPTPDDPEFAAWPRGSQSDPTYFPSMIKYMDKKIGQIIDSLKQWGLYNNTIVMFSGDNGTPGKIVSSFNNELIQGGKGQSTVYGTHVPLLVTWPGHIAPKTVNRNLVDFTDFLPTFAEAASQIVPADYGTVDGVSFYKQLTGAVVKPRDWVFCHFKPNGEDNQNIFKRWANTKKYKLYDFNYNFYDIVKDPLELTPLTTLTPLEQKIKDSLRVVIDSHN